jgi:hypothetical protein
MIGHRRQRERQIMRLLGEAPRAISALVPKMYAGLDERLHGAAAQSVLAHLIDLERRGQVIRADEVWRTA